jgi:hypothetical protein
MSRYGPVERRRWRRERGLAEVLVDGFVRYGLVALATTAEIDHKRYTKALVVLVLLALLSAACIIGALLWVGSRTGAAVAGSCVLSVASSLENSFHFLRTLEPIRFFRRIPLGPR